MRRLSNGAKYRYQNCAYADKNSAQEGVPGERLTKDQGRKDGVEDETGLFSQRGCSCFLFDGGYTYRLESRKNGQREGGDLDGTPDDIRDDEHKHAQLVHIRLLLLGTTVQVAHTCHLFRLYAGLRTSQGSFSSSRRCDLRWSVRPIACRLVEINPTITPTCNSRVNTIISSTWICM